MIDILKSILPYISGLYTLPWILVGLIVTVLIAKVIGSEKIDRIMKKIGLILLYFFIPLLLFRIFLKVDFGTEQIAFVIVTTIILIYMYVLAYVYAKYKAKKYGLKKSDSQILIKTILTNQGRSSAFIGGALLASPWFVEAAIFIALVGIALFFFIPFILSYMHKKETHKSDENIKALPWYLRLYPWYLLSFALAAIIIHGPLNVSINWDDPLAVVFTFYTALTIPAALYYVGAGIHPRDLKISEIKKLFSLKNNSKKDHWPWVRNIFVLTVIITPLIISLVFGLLLIFGLISTAWFAIVVINSFLPVTSTNMFLVSYGIDKKVTALSITWTTIVCVPIIVFLIYVFTIFL
jgi:predicted permease